MDQLIPYIATGLVSLVVGLLLQRFQARPKLLYWVPGSFLFNVSDPKVALRTDSLTIQNTGRLPAHNIEIIHEQRPDHFQFSTALEYTESTTPDGRHIIKIPSLGSQEHINIQLLSHSQSPVLSNVRCAEGQAQLIQVHLQRIYPNWLLALVGLVILTGAGFTLYWLIKAIVFISIAIGVV
jgi:hypothetical protein